MSSRGTNIIFVLSFLNLGDGRFIKLFYNITKGLIRIKTLVFASIP